MRSFQELPSPFLVLSTTRLTMRGIRHIGVITSAKTMAGGGSLNSSVGQSLKNLVWISTNISSTKGFGHGTNKQSNISSVQRLRLLYELQLGDRRFWVRRGNKSCLRFMRTSRCNLPAHVGPVAPVIPAAWVHCLLKGFEAQFAKKFGNAIHCWSTMHLITVPAKPHTMLKIIPTS